VRSLEGAAVLGQRVTECLGPVTAREPHIATGCHLNGAGDVLPRLGKGTAQTDPHSGSGSPEPINMHHNRSDTGANKDQPL